MIVWSLKNSTIYTVNLLSSLFCIRGNFTDNTVNYLTTYSGYMLKLVGKKKRDGDWLNSQSYNWFDKFLVLSA